MWRPVDVILDNSTSDDVVFVDVISDIVVLGKSIADDVIFDSQIFFFYNIAITCYKMSYSQNTLNLVGYLAAKVRPK